MSDVIVWIYSDNIEMKSRFGKKINLTKLLRGLYKQMVNEHVGDSDKAMLSIWFFRFLQSIKESSK